MQNLTQEERLLMERLKNSDSLDVVPGVYTESKGIGAKLAGISGNPIFKSQFDLNFKTYFAKAGAIIAPAALDVTLQTQLPAFIFGTSDMSGGFKKIKSFFGLNGWDYATANAKYFGIKGVDKPALTVFQTIPVDGDLWIEFQKTIGADTYTALVVIHCPQVAYGTLLDSISSDKMYLNMIRYRVAVADVAQLKNQVTYVIQSLLGKTQNDYIAPNTFITGMTQNPNIADIPIEFGVDKNLILGTWIDYSVQNIDWTLTVFSTEKIKA